MGNDPTKLEQENNNLETFSLVWLDGQVTSNENIKTQGQLRTLINHLKTFDDDQQCEEYIRSLSENDRIVFMSSGQLGKEVVPRIHHLRQIFSIYIYCINKQKNEQWANEFIKVQGVFVVLGELINQIRVDQERRKHNKVDEQLSISIYNTKHLDKHWKTEANNHFIYSQVLTDCLLQMPITSTEKTELISLCKSEYAGNKAELKIINEFERDYTSERAIWWYTRGFFLGKMLNKALRIQNIELLFLFRHVIHDIQYQLEKTKSSSPVYVYRGQLMSKDELQMLKDSFKEFISINTFLTAIHNRKSALWFLFDSKISDDIERVLFEIRAEDDLDDVKAFNNIQSKSYYNREEIMFSIGSIFQLIDIRLGEDNIWIIQMTLCTNNHLQLKPIFEHIEKEYGDTKTSLLGFGLVSQKMNKFDEAGKYYSRLIKLLPQQHKHIIQCQNAIKTIAIDKQNYLRALNSMNKSAEIYMKGSRMSENHLAIDHSQMGETYQNKGDFQRALASYEKAMSIWKKSSNDDRLEVGNCYNHMALIYQENDQYDKALEYYQKAKIILVKHLSMNHPDVCAVFEKIGDMHQELTQYDQALENYIQSLEIDETCTSQHPSSISLMHKIAFIYEQAQNFQQALLYYNKIASLLPSTHVDVAKNKENIQRVSNQL